MQEEKSFAGKMQLESRYSKVTDGSIKAHVNYTIIKLNTDKIFFLAYEMMEGLHKGENIVWGLTVQSKRNRALQLSIRYDGKKSQSIS